MNRRRSTLALCALCPLLLGAQPLPNANLDAAAIRQAGLDYLEGWYQGSVERVDRALHPDLAKRHLQASFGGTQILSQTSKSNLLEWTKAGAGLKAAKEVQKVEVEVLEVRGNIATAKAVSGEFVEYMHLVRTGEKWQIVNILWTPAKPSKS